MCLVMRFKGMCPHNVLKGKIFLIGDFIMEQNKFDLKTFQDGFDVSLRALIKAEKVTRSELMTLSRSVLEAVHETGDISYVNRILEVLTPVNRKVAKLYFQMFTGFRYDSESDTFTRKDKKNYDEKKEACDKFLTDPLNNIWSWAGRHVDVEPKAFDAESLKKSIETIIKKATKSNINKMEILKATMDAGFTMDELIEFMSTLEGVEVEVK